MTTTAAIGIREQLSQKISDAQFEAISKSSAEDLDPGITLGSVASFLLSLLILSVPFALMIAAVCLLVFVSFNPLTILIAMIVIGTAWTLLPAVPRIYGRVYTSRELPTLFGLLDKLAEEMSAPKLDGVIFLPGYNAFIGRFGWKRERVLGIGMALWHVLSREEKTAVLAHELSHEVNGDPSRGLIIGSAVTTLSNLILLLSQRSSIEAEGIMPLILRAVSWVIRSVLTLILHIVILLQFRSSQRAEYYADLRAAHVSGAEGMISLLRKLCFDSLIEEAIVKGWKPSPDRGKAFLESLTGYIDRAPAESRAYLIERMERERSKVDATHPPSIYRIEMLKRNAPTMPAFDAGSIDWAEIDEELSEISKVQGEILLQSIRHL